MLEYFFNPRTIAVIGASHSKGKVGHDIFHSLLNEKKKVYPVNPNLTSVLGEPAYASVADIRAEIDLAVIAVPAKIVPQVIEECGKKSVKAVIIISSGFSESGNKALETEVVEIARKHNIRILGPNCLGVIVPRQKMNASFFNKMPEKGGIAFISQSGALGVAILDWAIKQEIGLSAFVSMGNAGDVDFADMLTYFEKDPDTKAICIYMESLKDGRKFLEAANGCKKPIIVLKAGRTEAGQKAAATHTAALATEDRVYDGAFKQHRLIRVNTLYQLFEIAQYFVYGHAPKGKRGLIITNAGGPGVLASDGFEREGIEIVKIDEAREELDKVLPAQWSKNNPIDIVGDAMPDRYKAVFDVIKSKKFFDFVLCILTPQAMTEPKDVAELFVKFYKETGVPCFGCFMGGDLIGTAKRILRENHITNFVEPDYAAKVISKMVKK